MPTRTRREASSRASAMIMQQNEIERSRYNYSLNNKQSTSTNIRRQAHKTTPVNDDIPPPSSSPVPTPSIINIPIEIVPKSSSNIVTTNSPLVAASTISKYPLLTEASLAEHNRLHGTMPLYHTAKRDSLIKWTQDLTSYDRLSPPYAELDRPSESNNSFSIQNKPTGCIDIYLEFFHKNIHSYFIFLEALITDSMTSSHLSGRHNINPSTFLFPSTTYPFDLHPYYSVLPCWQYSSKRNESFK